MDLRFLLVGLSLTCLALPLAGCSESSDIGTGGTAGSGTGGSAGEGDTGGSGGGAVSKCAADAPEALRACASAVNAAWASCYANDDGPCTADNADVASALSTLDGAITESCSDGDFGLLTTSALVGRLQYSCQSEANSLAWRSFGGPQGAVWPDATTEDRTCMQGAHDAGAAVMDGALAAMNECLSSGECDPASVDTTVNDLVASAIGDIDDACTSLASLVGLAGDVYSERALFQAQRMVATAHAEVNPLSLPVGPSNVEETLPRGEYRQVVLDGEKWGTLCGDGTPFAFQVRLAPEGEPLDRILVGLQGGGVCALEADCVPRFENRLNGNNNLFNAMDDEPLSVGIASVDPAVSPFANWTKIYVPYCNQDVFAGGGVVETLGELDLPRYGAENMRAAVRYVRDVIWMMKDQEEGPGWRPDEVVALFGGWSAGGYGALYNYHWFLDDLLWPNTTAFPDASGALDNGQLFGVAALGVAKIPAWGAQKNLPPYCFQGNCALGPVLYEALSPRLKQVPQQQMLIVSNPKDDTQRRDAFFRGDETEEDFWNAEWINTMRQSYCDTKDLNGINYFYTSVSDESLHVVTLREELWLGSTPGVAAGPDCGDGNLDPGEECDDGNLEPGDGCNESCSTEFDVDGVVMRDWFERAINDPDNLQDRVEEANFVADIPGAQPYPCEVAP